MKEEEKDGGREGEGGGNFLSFEWLGLAWGTHSLLLFLHTLTLFILGGLGVDLEALVGSIGS